jgi:FkbM family methyltransferase
MEQQVREAARRYLPAAIRKPLGALAGTVNGRIILPFLGLVFDLKGARFHADGCTFLIPKDITSRSFRSCFLQRTYEQYERELIPRFIRPEDRVLELGACIGVISCVTNKLLADKSGHVVVEANPFCLPALHRNKELNESGFLIEHCAVDTRPEVTFYLYPCILAGSSQRRTNRPVRLPAKSLQQLERERGPFSVLIIDIEGSEREVFEDSADVLKRYRLVIAELHEWAIGADGVERCRQILRTSGLVFVERAGIVEVWERK